MHERKCKIWSLTWMSTPIVRLKHCLSFGLLLFFFLFFPGLQFGLNQGLLLGFPGVEGNPSGLGGVLLVLHSWLVSQCALFKSNRLLCIRVKNFQSFLIDMKFWTQSLFWLQAGIFRNFRNFSLFKVTQPFAAIKRSGKRRYLLNLLINLDEIWTQ